MITFALALLLCLVVFPQMDEQRIYRQRFLAGMSKMLKGTLRLNRTFWRISAIAARGTMAMNELREQLQRQIPGSTQ